MIECMCLLTHVLLLCIILSFLFMLVVDHLFSCSYFLVLQKKRQCKVTLSEPNNVTILYLQKKLSRKEKDQIELPISVSKLDAFCN